MNRDVHIGVDDPELQDTCVRMLENAAAAGQPLVIHLPSDDGRKELRMTCEFVERVTGRGE